MEHNKKDVNIAYVIGSVVLAFLLWLIVANISDAQTTREIINIPVTQLNGDVLEELDKVYDVASGDTVDIVIKGRRSLVETLGRDDFVATADLANMSITNAVPIEVSLKNSNNAKYLDITCINSTMQLNLEEKVIVQLPVKVNMIGETKEGFAVGENTCNPNFVTIEGPKSAVNKITDVLVSIDVSGKKADFISNVEMGIYDAYGEQIKNDKIEISQNIISVSTVVYPTKEIPIVVDVRGTPGDGYAVKDIVYQPQTVAVAAPSDVLDGIEEISIRDISVSGLTEDLNHTLDIKDYLPAQAIVAGADSQLVLNVSISQLTEKTLKLTSEDIKLKNKAAETSYNVEVENASIVIRGFADLIEPLTLKDLEPVIDCTALPVGNHSNVTVKCKELDDITIEIKGSVNVSVEGK
ncbi:MAG: YbbR-like domain-containing protein [Wujia sp.]